MKVLLTTFYDERCTGLRILASCLKKADYDVKLCLLKKHCAKQVENFPEVYRAYQTISSVGYTMAMCDVNPITQIEKELLYKYISEERPQIIGFSLRSYLNDIAIDLMREIKKKFPWIIIIAGGYAPTLEPELFVPHCDAVIRGEGEEAIVEFCNCIKNNISFYDLKNISYFHNNKCVNNPLRCAEKNISVYPWAFGFHDGEDRVVVIENNTVSVGDSLQTWKAFCFLLGRGCLGSCSYCSGGNWTKIYNNYGFVIPKRRLRNIDDAINELKRAKDDGYEKIHFTDEYFAASIDYLNEFLDRYEKEINLPVEMYLHYEMILNHPEILYRLKKLHLKKVAVGIQSGSEKFARDVYNRKISHDTLINFIKLVHKYDISTILHLIVGNPLETESIFRESLQFLKEIPFIRNFDSLICFRFTPFPHSPIVEKYGEKVLSPVSNAVFERQGCLAHLRLLLPDNEFLPLLNNEQYVNDPSELKKIYYKLLGITSVTDKQ